MYRLPLIKMCSRETNRLPAEEVQKRLGYRSDGFVLESSGLGHLPSTKFFVYLFTDNEVTGRGFGKFQFILVEVVGYKEIVLDRGSATGPSISFEQPRHSKFQGLGEKIGKYMFYCDFFEPLS